MRIQFFHVIGIVWVSITREIEEQNFGVPYLQHEYWEQNGRVYTIHSMEVLMKTGYVR